MSSDQSEADPPEVGTLLPVGGRYQVFAPIEVDCSEWDGGLPADEGTFVPYATKTHPAIEVDCSAWGGEPSPPIAVVLSLQFEPTTEPDWMSPLEGVLRRLNDAETALDGGAGLIWDRRRSTPLGSGKVVVVVSPRNRDGAEARLARLIEWVRVSVPECVSIRLAA